MERNLSRRTLLGGFGAAGALAVAATLPGGASESDRLPEAPPLPLDGRRHELRLVAQERDGYPLGAGGPRMKLWTYGERPLPIFRVALGDRLTAELHNRLPEHTSIHWHGVRVPNDQDGVQYVTQPPTEPGQRHLYDFVPPDAGTYFFHPHCNETGQVGRGLAGVLIVTGDEPDPCDADIVLAVKDWRIGPRGEWLPFETAEGASRAGTFGTRRSVNLEADFARAVPARADVRVRIVNMDSSRTLTIGVEGADAAVIATDGQPVLPFAPDTWRLGVAMRVDLLLRTGQAGAVAKVIDFGAAEPYTLATLTAIGDPVRREAFAPRPLFASRVPRPDLDRAERLVFAFGATSGAAVFDAVPDTDPLSRALLDSLCTGDRTYWAINRISWPNDGHRNLPPPLAVLRAGKSYIFELVNTTPHIHPIHLHGHAFEVLSSSRQRLPRFSADTVLIQPRERVEIAFVAAPGAWMLHCHVLEHIDHGMMGWLRVMS